jgi:ribose transport system ATP-binding protein
VCTKDLKRINFRVASKEMVAIVAINETGINHLIDLFTDDKRKIPGMMRASQVAIVDENKSLIMNMTIAENLFVINKDKNKIVNYLKMGIETEKLLKIYQMQISSDVTVDKLSNLEQIQLIIIKAFLNGQKVVILFGIDKFLSLSDRRVLYDYVAIFRNKGMAFINFLTFPDPYIHLNNRHYIFKSNRIEKIFFGKQISYATIAPYLDSKISSQNIKNSKAALSSFRFEDVDYTLYSGNCLAFICKNIEKFNSLIKTSSTLQNSFIIAENPIANMLYERQSYMFNLTFGLADKLKKQVIPTKYIYSIEKEFHDEIFEFKHLKTVAHISKEEKLKLIYYRILVLRPKIVVIVQPFIGMDMEQQHYVLNLITILKKNAICVVIISKFEGDLNIVADNMIEI